MQKNDEVTKYIPAASLGANNCTNLYGINYDANVDDDGDDWKPMRGMRKRAECRAEWLIVGWTARYLKTSSMMISKRASFPQTVNFTDRGRCEFCVCCSKMETINLVFVEYDRF